MEEPVYERVTWWLRDYGKMILFFIGVVGVTIALGVWVTRDLDEPQIEEEAEVVRFAAYSHDKGPIPVVVVRLKDGTIRQLRVHRSRTHNCRAGGKIRMIRRGNLMTVHRRGCDPPNLEIAS